MIDRLNDPTEASIIHGQLQSWIQAYYEKKGLSEGELSVLYRSYGNLFIVTFITLTSTNPSFFISLTGMANQATDSNGAANIFSPIRPSATRKCTKGVYTARNSIEKLQAQAKVKTTFPTKKMAFQDGNSSDDDIPLLQRLRKITTVNTQGNQYHNPTI